MKAERTRETGRLVPVVIFAAALAARLWHLASLRPLPSFDHPYAGLDGEIYTRLGRLIAGGDIFPAGLIDTAPLYAWWLGAFFRFFGPDPLPPRIAQAILGAAAALLILLAGRRIAGRMAGTIAGIAAALYPPFLMHEGTLQSGALVPVTVSLLLLALLGAGKRAAAAPLSGLLLGLSILLRPDLLLLLPPLLFWVFLSTFRKRAAFLFLAGFLLPTLPFCVKSSVDAGGFVPLTAHGGIHFYIGNHAGADGRLSPVEGVRPTPAGFALDARSVARRRSGENLSIAAVSRYWYRKGLDRIISDPAGYLRLLGRKAILYWNDYEGPNNEDLYFLRRFSPPLRLPVPSFGLVAPFALFGLFLAPLRGKDRGLFAIFVAAGLAAALLFFVTGRYRLPVLPAFLPLAGAGAIAWAGAVRKKRWTAAALLPLLLFCNLPVKRYDFAAPESRLGSSYFAAGEYGEAEKAYGRALTINPALGEAKRGLARLLLRRGREEEGAALYREAAGSGREDRSDLASFLAEAGRIDEAIGILDSLLAADPEDPVALGHLGACMMEKGEAGLSAELLERAIRVDPESPGPWLNLALLRAGEGRLEEAVRLFRRHLEITPLSEKGLFNAGAAEAMSGDLEEALRFWFRLERINPRYPNLEKNIARARLMREETEER